MELSQYRITTSLADAESNGRAALRTFTVKAAYPTADDKLPGWTLFKDGEHKIVAMVWDGVAAMVERIEATPQPARGGGVWPPASRPSPAGTTTGVTMTNTALGGL